MGLTPRRRRQTLKSTASLSLRSSDFNGRPPSWRLTIEGTTASKGGGRWGSSETACMLSSSPNGAPSVSSACVRRTGKRYRPMSNAKKPPSGIHWPTDGEEAAIERGIATGPDAPELTATALKAMRPTGEVAPELLKGALRRRGPQKSPTRELITIRL